MFPELLLINEILLSAKADVPKNQSFRLPNYLRFKTKDGFLPKLGVVPPQIKRSRGMASRRRNGCVGSLIKLVEQARLVHKLFASILIRNDRNRDWGAKAGIAHTHKSQLKYSRF